MRQLDGRVTRKILTLEMRRGVVQQQLTLAPGKHEVRVQVRWDDNVKAARITIADGAHFKGNVDMDV